MPPHEEQEERIRARLALLIALAALVAIAAGPVSGSETPPLRAAADGHTSVKRCKTVTPHTYNKRVRLLREISGDNRRGTLTKRKRCKYGAYADLGRAVRKARADCLKRVNKPNADKSAMARNKAGTTGASFYSYGDSGGLTGACGTFLPYVSSDYSFAVLSTGDVSSSCGQRFYFHRHGVTRLGFQGDTGGGGGKADGLPRTFDFWNPNQTKGHRPGLARDLRLTKDGLGRVQYSKHNCWAR